jgi:carbonic anhydrase
MTDFPDKLTLNFKRFYCEEFAPNIEEYQQLATQGQKPETMIISCCDSRVPPTKMFADKPGNLFVVRNVANLVPPYEETGKYHGVSAALEFAVEGLNVADIIVLGHSKCGGIHACLNHNHPETPREKSFINSWMSILDEACKTVLADSQHKTEDAQLTSLEKLGIITSLDNLRSFPFVQKALTAGRLKIHGAYFDILTGKLFAFNPATKQFAEV